MRRITCNTMLALLLISAAFCKNNSHKTANVPAQKKDAGNALTPPAAQVSDSFAQTSGSVARAVDSVAQAGGPAASTADSIAHTGAVPAADASSDPGTAIANALSNLQLNQMKNNNPLKQVAQNMIKAEHDGTRGPDKIYTAEYKPEQSAEYTVPVQGDAAVYELQYTGGSSLKGKQDGAWKNIYINTKNNTGWNVFTESYMASSAINMKVHSTILSHKDSAYIVSFNSQYQKYNREPLSERGKYESEVKVQKIGDEKMFGYSCVHIRVSYTITALHQTVHSTDDEWYSNDVPGAQYVSPVLFESHSPQVVQKIMAAGCSGALVNFKSAEMHLQLTGITKKDAPDTTFTLPANYQLDKNTGLYGLQ
ncbi:MAG TPA: DUF4412 domain-containing protein [Puia sp.]|uniref:DUF4412 domain-containing protein n=1 Tax=Puia sp. TaxID=2045100 RepID=UPI002BCAD353|nr:DUF4412 domain-containing protein [Puia sp.]HVU94807.1 DUF4412 domain-containing protein [Puia sp.]